MNRLAARINKLEEVAEPASRYKSVLWFCGEESREEAMERAGVQEGDDVLIHKIEYVSPQEKVDG